eukprot:scaffold53722_cov42-Prasinocladus_malaysianus.AAC.1
MYVYGIFTSHLSPLATGTYETLYEYDLGNDDYSYVYVCIRIHVVNASLSYLKSLKHISSATSQPICHNPSPLLYCSPLCLAIKRAHVRTIRYGLTTLEAGSTATSCPVNVGKREIRSTGPCSCAAQRLSTKCTIECFVSLPVVRTPATAWWRAEWRVCCTVVPVRGQCTSYA